MMQGGLRTGTTLDQLPREILIDIASCLFLEDIAHLSAANRTFYAVFDPILYLIDSKPYFSRSIYWAAENASIAVAQKALAAGTSVNEQSNPTPHNSIRKLQFSTWPEFSSRLPAIRAPRPLAKRIIIPAEMAALVELLLQAGADMTMVDGNALAANLNSFHATPLGYAMYCVDRPYFRAVQGNHAEVRSNGCFSPLTRAKLAIVGGHLSQLQDILALYASELDLKGENGRELHNLAYKDDRQDMCRCLYYWTHGKEADSSYMCDSTGRFRRYLIDCVQRAVENGAICANVQTDNKWSEFRDIEGIHVTFRYWIDDLGKRRRPTTLTDVAICIRDRELLELAISLEDETVRNPEVDQLRLLQCALSWGDATWAESLLDDKEGLDLQSDHLAETFVEILYNVIHKGYANCVEMLIRRGPSITGLPRTVESRRSIIAETIMYCQSRSSLVVILEHLLKAGADTTQVFADLERWYPKNTGYWLSGIGLRMLCQPGCMELLEQHGICVYRPHRLYLLAACEQHNYALVRRLVDDGVLQPDFNEKPTPTIGLQPMTGAHGDEDYMSESLMNDYMLHAHCRNRYPNAKYAADDVKILQLLLTQGLDINKRHFGHSVLEYACLELRKRHSHAEEMICCLIENGADVGAMEEDMGFTVPDKSDSGVISRYLLDITSHVKAGDRLPLSVLQTICRSDKPTTRKRVDLFMAHNPDILKNKTWIYDAMIQAAVANNVGTLQALMRYAKGLPRGIVTATRQHGLRLRMLHFLMALGLDCKETDLY
ncbi:hypothetical protein VHEMI10595 [[Torrubiella] hemipterigena]|uniref:F-box domain-containing protein n=1 Tax=[Torrubiella] hemipterigena TaxID=1531966 RepID=A0A0A1TSG6_9HYPO|nr:hypothetical protein VHEMI10595 [[Torrubiella] hemipterigena]